MSNKVATQQSVLVEKANRLMCTIQGRHQINFISS